MLARDPDELEEEEEPFTADPEGLRRFLEDEVLPWFEKRKKEIANRPLIREQAFGEALDPDKLERLGRYEVHLDRKLERMLSCCCASRTCGRARSRANPFRKKWPDAGSIQAEPARQSKARRSWPSGRTFEETATASTAAPATDCLFGQNYS